MIFTPALTNTYMSHPCTSTADISQYRYLFYSLNNQAENYICDRNCDKFSVLFQMFGETVMLIISNSKICSETPLLHERLTTYTCRFIYQQCTQVGKIAFDSDKQCDRLKRDMTPAWNIYQYDCDVTPGITYFFLGKVTSRIYHCFMKHQMFI